eukprot:scaffold50397_cov65-Cyclotella_meneghiniana.AAC.3
MEPTANKGIQHFVSSQLNFITLVSVLFFESTSDLSFNVVEAIVDVIIYGSRVVPVSFDIRVWLGWAVVIMDLRVKSAYGVSGFSTVEFCRVDGILGAKESLGREVIGRGKVIRPKH